MAKQQDDFFLDCITDSQYFLDIIDSKPSLFGRVLLEHLDFGSRIRQAVGGKVIAETFDCSKVGVSCTVDPLDGLQIILDMLNGKVFKIVWHEFREPPDYHFVMTNSPGR